MPSERSRLWVSSAPCLLLRARPCVSSWLTLEPSSLFLHKAFFSPFKDGFILLLFQLYWGIVFYWGIKNRVFRYMMWDVDIHTHGRITAMKLISTPATAHGTCCVRCGPTETNRLCRQVHRTLRLIVASVLQALLSQWNSDPSACTSHLPCPQPLATAVLPLLQWAWVW